ncbi:hypothetical protein [Bradyrhizobium paxllaeri]|uniref:hypothetical protein n=1 Tax=Bradyrhizobium paxllaeri TaxID=190148 RepID=UPI00114678EE|nr:hypothetical protein [Bradyrhizobium paxllaeri]
MRSVGKQARDESGKYPVNEDDEEILCAHVRVRRISQWVLRVPIHASVLKHSAVIASEAKQSIARHNG